MGGHHDGPEPLIKDPAFERFYRFRETLGQRFRVTPRNVIPTFGLLLGIPIGVGWLAYQTQGRFMRHPKRRSKPIHEAEFKLRD